MHKTIAGIIISLGCGGPISAEIRFDWRGDNNSKAAREGIEQCIKAAALQYTDKKYADRGGYNFVTSREMITVRFGERNQYAVDGWSNEHYVFVKKSILADNARVTVAMVHEFSHAYDTIHDIKGTRRGERMRIIAQQNERDIEARATLKESYAVQELHTKIPKDIYDRLLKCYAVGDYYRAYDRRGPILVEWDRRIKVTTQTH
ncbi:hypothetical protein HY639_06135 [Candidatus Woesearchaeota archaeon]|nr:hypothetical protein [Candidatus Woesearchaeota archaeon]